MILYQAAQKYPRKFEAQHSPQKRVLAAQHPFLNGLANPLEWIGMENGHLL
jgi:hypothetical protein